MKEATHTVQTDAAVASSLQGSAKQAAVAPAKRAIEEYFPIVEINRLAIPERNAFKPIYQMHKWFARRASCVFRAILLGALKPAGTDIMEEFYRDHTNDPDTEGKIVLDPFMGGGTTVVEGLRLGCRVIGLDLNPVAWFIVKTEVQPVDLVELEAAFQRLASRETASGKTVREELLSHYKTKCPSCGVEDADVVYTFWVKAAICTNPECKKQVPLFSEHLVAQKTPSIRFHEAICPYKECDKSFDWEIEPAALVGDSQLMCASALDGAGEGRGNKRWAFSLPDQPAKCPWCERQISPLAKTARPQRKKVKLSVLCCPTCSSVFQYRGTPPDELPCPACSQNFRWELGNTRKGGDFVCPHCGHTDAVIESLRRLPKSELLPINMYALQGYCSTCAGDSDLDEDEEESQHEIEQAPVIRHTPRAAKKKAAMNGLLWKNGGKFLKAITPADLHSYQQTCERWQQEKNELPYPKQEVPDGQETHRLLEHHYQYWSQMFNPRQLLCLSTLVKGIIEESKPDVQELLLSAFFSTLEGSNMFARFKTDQRRSETPKGVFARHDFQPKLTPCEDNVWGLNIGKGFSRWMDIILRGKRWAKNPEDSSYAEGSSSTGKRGRLVRKVRSETAEAFSIQTAPTIEIPTHGVSLIAASSTAALKGTARGVFLVATDPPYAGNVNYAELADFFYVWLRLALLDRYPWFAAELTPKAEEIIENRTRGKTMADFESGLRQVFSLCGDVTQDDGLLVFTFHHSEGSAWEALLEATCEAGWIVESIYPVQGESESSMHLLSGDNIAYDLIHVCRKRASQATLGRVAWATLRSQIKRDARREIERIQRGVYGEERDLGDADKLIVLIGKCLQLYSRHYGAVVDHNFAPVPLRDALADIRMMVEQLVSLERPLPNELEDIDRASYIWLTALSEKKEIKSDEVHKATRGIADVDELLGAGLIKRGRVRRGRTFEVKTPAERYTSLLERFSSESVPSSGLFGDLPVGNGSSLFIDRLHFLIALTEGKQDLRPWIERWKPEIPQFRAAADYLLKRGRDELKPSLRKIIGMLEVGPLAFE